MVTINGIEDYSVFKGDESENFSVNKKIVIKILRVTSTFTKDRFSGIFGTKFLKSGSVRGPSREEM